MRFTRRPGSRLISAGSSTDAHPTCRCPKLCAALLTWKLRSNPRRHDRPVALRLIYHAFAMLLSWIVLHARFDAAKEIEILLLRHQLAVLQRHRPRPRLGWTDRAVIAEKTEAYSASV